MSILQPKFYFFHQMTRIFCLIFPFFLLVGTPVLFKILRTYIDSSIAVLFYAVIIYVLIDLCIACLISFIIQAFYANSQFKILKDRVEYSSNFFGLRITDLKYKNIKEMSFVQGILQKKFGLGTIFLLTHASPQNPKSRGSGLKIFNIQNSQKVYDLLKKEVDKAETYVPIA